MNLKDYTTEDLEKELEERKKVKPLATPERVADVLRLWRVGFVENFKGLIEKDFTWPAAPEPREWEKELRLGRAFKKDNWQIFSKTAFYLRAYQGWEFIPFDGAKVGKIDE